MLGQFVAQDARQGFRLRADEPRLLETVGEPERIDQRLRHGRCLSLRNIVRPAAECQTVTRPHVTVRLRSVALTTGYDLPPRPLPVLIPSFHRHPFISSSIPASPRHSFTPSSSLYPPVTSTSPRHLHIPSSPLHSLITSTSPVTSAFPHHLCIPPPLLRPLVTPAPPSSFLRKQESRRTITHGETSSDRRARHAPLCGIAQHEMLRWGCKVGSRARRRVDWRRNGDHSSVWSGSPLFPE